MQDDDGQRRPSGAARYLTEDLDLRSHSNSSAPTAGFEWRVELNPQRSASPIDRLEIDTSRLLIERRGSVSTRSGREQDRPVLQRQCGWSRRLIARTKWRSNRAFPCADRSAVDCAA